MPRPITDSGFSSWSPDRLPELRGKRYLITGGNSGIGVEAAKRLAAAGADVVIACRNPAKAEAAVAEIGSVAQGGVEAISLDLSNLESVRQAAAEVRRRYDRLDGLVNNAGIMQTPRSTTKDGFELQLGTNHLGHFLLTGLLLDRIEAAGGRVVVVSSIAHRLGRIHTHDLMLADNYDPTVAYCQSKLANLLFAFELDRRLKAGGSPVSCIACHPGYSATNLQSTGPTGFFNMLYKPMNALLAQSASNGAIPIVLAAAGREAKPGGYYGPVSLGGMRGRVSDAAVAHRALDRSMAEWLWRESEKLVGFGWRPD